MGVSCLLVELQRVEGLQSTGLSRLVFINFCLSKNWSPDCQLIILDKLMFMAVLPTGVRGKLQFRLVLYFCFFCFRLSKTYSLNFFFKYTRAIHFWKLKMKNKKIYETNLNWNLKQIWNSDLHLFLENIEPRTEPNVKIRINIFWNMVSNWEKYDLICL